MRVHRCQPISRNGVGTPTICSPPQWMDQALRDVCDDEFTHEALTFCSSPRQLRGTHPQRELWSPGYLWRSCNKYYSRSVWNVRINTHRTRDCNDEPELVNTENEIMAIVRANRHVSEMRSSTPLQIGRHRAAVITPESRRDPTAVLPPQPNCLWKRISGHDPDRPSLVRMDPAARF